MEFEKYTVNQLRDYLRTLNAPGIYKYKGVRLLKSHLVEYAYEGGELHPVDKREIERQVEQDFAKQERRQERRQRQRRQRRQLDRKILSKYNIDEKPLIKAFLNTKKRSVYDDYDVPGYIPPYLRVEKFDGALYDFLLGRKKTTKHGVHVSEIRELRSDSVEIINRFNTPIKDFFKRITRLMYDPEYRDEKRKRIYLPDFSGKKMENIKKFINNVIAPLLIAISSNFKIASFHINVAFVKNKDKIDETTEQFVVENEVIYKSKALTYNRNTLKKDILEEIYKMLGGYDGGEYYFQGVQVLNLTPNETKINELVAFSKSKQLKFHEQSVASTSGAGLCIYETFMHVNDDHFKDFTLKYQRRKTKVYREMIYKNLHEEGEDIEKAVKTGSLIKALELLTKKYKTTILIVFYGERIYIDDDGLIADAPIVFTHSYDDPANVQYPLYSKRTSNPIRISEGKTKILKEVKDLECFYDTQQFLYERNKHVAPFVVTTDLLQTTEKLLEKEHKKNNEPILRPLFLKGKSSKEIHTYAFDYETYNDEQHMATPFAVCLYGDNNTDVAFYGNDCTQKFVDYIDENLFQDMNVEKTRPTEKIPIHVIYGWNNSRFDNLLLYREIYKRDSNAVIVFAENTIKMIRYGNIYFLDLNLYYVGSLANNASAFGLTAAKGVFPYTFPNGDNLDYVGPVPDVEYWKSEADRNEYIEKEGDVFRMKDYTLKYCTLDCKLTYEIGLLHQKQAHGKIGNRTYDTRLCPTGASIAKKMYTETGLKISLYKTPTFTQERESFFGGRTEVFHKSYTKGIDSDGGLHYIDINSAHPSGMAQHDMPITYRGLFELQEPVVLEQGEINPQWLYNCEVEYKGDNPHYIPNCLSRINGQIAALKNAPLGWRWGMEIREACLDGCEVRVKGIIRYDSKNIFDKFITHLYNERLKVKKTNPAKSMYYKLIINSLYGKFGQRVNAHTKMFQPNEDIGTFVRDNQSIITAFQSIEGGGTLVEYKTPQDEERGIGRLVRISSFIAMSTRCKLARLMRNVGHENVYYCDTDSVMSTVKPDDEFLHETELGKWGFECEPIEKAVFLAPKVYAYKTTDNNKCVKGKGFNAKELFTLEQYEEMIADPKKTLKENKTMFFRSYDGVKITPQERTLSAVYTKRKWDGNNSKAYADIDEFTLSQMNVS